MKGGELYLVAEAMRNKAAELARRNADINRRNGWVERAETQNDIARYIERIDVGALVDEAINLPTVSIDEMRAFELEARRLRLTDFRRNDNGFYRDGLTQRFWEMWRAGARFHAG